MPALIKSLDLSYDAVGVKSTDVLDRNEASHGLQLQAHRDQDHLQLQQQQQLQCEGLQMPQREYDQMQLTERLQQRERDHLPFQLHRDKLQQQQQQQQREQQRERERDREQQRDRERDREQHRDRERDREQLHQLQSINNLLLDLPPPSSFQVYPHDASFTQSSTSSNMDGDMSISDLFGLGLPRGSLMGSQSTSGSTGYRNYQHHGSNRNQGSSHQYYQWDDKNAINSNSSVFDTPGSPSSVTTPGTPSTPGSLYSNPYSNYSSSSSPTSRTSMQYFNSPSSPINSPYYGRPIRGSPPYSDCGSPTVECPHMVGCNGSRSNSPADSDTSGINSVDGSLSDIMNCLSLNPSSQYSCYPQSLGSLMSPEVDLYSNNRTAAFQRMAVKKYWSSPHQNTTSSQHQHSHAHNRGHHCGSNQNGSFLNSLLTHEKNCCPAGNSHMMSLNSPPVNILDPQVSLDRIARFHRNAAALCVATFTWSGLLPQRMQKPYGYSSKVFLGGLPWDITESLLIASFKQIGQIRVEWPGKDQSAIQPKGFAYIIFESEKQVRALLACCTHDFTNGGSWYYKISSKRIKAKQVQVIPWILEDSNYVKSSSQKLDPHKTVFVGALHGMLTAAGLAKIMDDLFRGVIYAGIDTDKHKYPIGSGRVTFNTKHSYMKAVSAAFIEIKTAKFTKKVQVDPYLEDSMCSGCSVQQGPYFCREVVCFRYFCRSCWSWQHSTESMWHHKPMMRNSKTNRAIEFSPNGANSGSRMINNPAI